MTSPEHPTHGISRDSLSPRVRSYDDNLDTQVRDLFDKYHLPHYDQDVLAKAIEDRTVTLADAHRLRDLLAQRDHIRRTGELPPEVRETCTQEQLDTAREILGAENVYGHEQVNNIFETTLSLKDLPSIPYSPEDLEKAKELNMKLILRISHDHEGTPLTPQRMNDLLQPRFTAEGRGKLLYKVDWYQDEPFYTTETPISPTPSFSPSLREGEKIMAEWKLVTTDILPNSTSKNYLEQTILLRDTLASHGWLTDEEAEEVTDDKLTVLEPLLTSNWQEAARLLSKLAINQNHRRTMPQALYDTSLVYLTETDPTKRPLERTYDWTQSRSSLGNLVDLGGLDSDGLGVNRWGPDCRIGGIGACVSR